jgi:nitric oxide reductase NorE protein
MPNPLCIRAISPRPGSYHRPDLRAGVLDEAVAGKRATRLRLPGEAGVWVLIAGDLVMFSIFFITFMYYRSRDADAYAQSQAHLSQMLGAVNTVLMLTSSWFVATAVHSARERAAVRSRSCLIFAILLGAAFCAVKVIEYHEKLAAGITPLTNDFYMFYFMLTGIHCLHVILGIGVLAFMTYIVRARPIEGAGLQMLESGASFWHLVDLLWIVLFAILYLVK